MESRAAWLDRAEMLTPPLPWDRPHWKRGEGPTVVLLHGLWRGWRAMQPLARALSSRGFATLNIPYPSARMPVHRIAARVRGEIARTHTGEPIHFVTHSLGGIVLRALLAEETPWTTGRIVMLAPPNRGSEIVDWTKRHPLLHGLLGPAGRSLATDGVPASLPGLPPAIEAAVIMGNRGRVPFFRKLLASDHDGIVSAANGQLPGVRRFSVIPADHTFIQMHPETLRLTLGFLADGRWAP